MAVRHFLCFLFFIHVWLLLLLKGGLVNFYLFIVDFPMDYGEYLLPVLPFSHPFWFIWDIVLKSLWNHDLSTVHHYHSASSLAYVSSPLAIYLIMETSYLADM